MQDKIAIRKKALSNRKNKYFEVSDFFFKPLIKLLNIKKNIKKIIFPFISPQSMK